jgi:two-component system sensor histidine kinase TtrS
MRRILNIPLLSPALLLLAFFLLGWAGNSFASNVVRIGVLSYREIDGAGVNWGEMKARLTAAIPEKQFELRPLTGPQLREAVQKNELEFLLTNGTQYVALSSEFGIQRIATVMLPEAVSPEQALGSAVLTLVNRTDITQLSDVNGQRVAVVANDAFGGYLAAERELLGAGVDLEAKDAHLVFVGFPMQKTIEALRDRRADVAIVRTCLLEHLVARGALRMADYKVISPRPVTGFPCVTSTRLYPDWPLAAARGTDRQLAKAVAVALLSMPTSTMGLSWSIPADYQSIMELDRELMIGPFAELRTSTFRGLLKNYRPYLLTVLLLLAGVIAHFIRVQILVKRRTNELRRSQAIASDLQRKAEHMARLSILGEMSSTLAHELNQPLATIASYAQGLARHCAAGQLTKEMVSSVNNEIVAQTERADKVIRNVRSFARKRMAARERKALAITVQEAIETLSTMRSNFPKVTLENHLEPGAMLMADHLQIQQVLFNLMKNAADSMAGLPAEQRVINLILDRSESGYTIAVVDQGPPISTETLEHLFEPFFTTKTDGLGLGLAICKSIVEAHGGGLEVYSRHPSQGLVFLLNLPELNKHE